MVEISGTITDSDGDGIGGVKVTVINQSTDSVAASGTTASDGTYSFSVGSDTYHVLISYEDANGNRYNNESNPYVT